MEGKEGWVVVEALPDDAVVKETNERKVTTHDEVEDILETEEVQHLGNASNDVSHFFISLDLSATILISSLVELSILANCLSSS